MITERVMPIAMFLFFLMIGINGFIAVAGQMSIGNGHVLSQYIGTDQNKLSSDLNTYASSITYQPSQFNGATDNADSGFWLFTIAASVVNGIGQGVSNFIGIQNLSLVENMLFGIEIYMNLFASWFPQFAAIFLSIQVFTLGIKILVFGYAGSIFVRTIVGRRL